MKNSGFTGVQQGIFEEFPYAFKRALLRVLQPFGALRWAQAFLVGFPQRSGLKIHGLPCVGVYLWLRSLRSLESSPRGSIFTTIIELAPQNHNKDGLSGPNSIIVVYIDPLG